MGGSIAPGLFEQGKDGGGELEIHVRRDLDIERRAFDDRAALSQSLDELAVVGDVPGDARALGIRFEKQIAAENLGRLGEVELLAGHGAGGEVIVADAA